MATDDNSRERNHNVRFGQAYSQREIKEQEYRQLGFWSPVLSAAIPVTLVATLATGGAAAPLVGIAVLARGAVALGRAYYRSVYRFR